METMHAAGRRSLPPVPRTSAERPAPPADRPEPDGHDPDTPTERFVVDLATGEQRTVSDADALEDDAPEDDAVATHVVEGEAPGDDAAVDDREDAGSPVADTATADDLPEAEHVDLDPAQEFVARLRAGATAFAEAAGAGSAVVREAVPPARHRRARCRLVLRYADGSEVDVTFLGPAGRPGTPSRHGFDRQIRRWLADGQHREDAWLVDDPDSSDGLAVDLSAWVAAA